MAGRHISSTTTVYGDVNSKGSKVHIGYCSVCNRKKYMTVSDNTRQPEKLGRFFKILGRVSAKVRKQLANN